VAFDLLPALYREEARHRAEVRSESSPWPDRAIVERILEHNLHGIDLDPRAVQIAAAALWLKARRTCPDAQPEQLNLVASNLRLSSLPDDDPALLELRRAVERETGIPAALTDSIVHALRGADHLGSLLKVDAAVDDAVRRHEAVLGRREPRQGNLWEGFGEEERVPVEVEQAKASVLGLLEGFLERHTSGDDLGLRLRGEQLAARVRFVRMAREGVYDIVVGNPPYQGTSKMRDAAYVQSHYPLGKADIYAAFLERGLQLVRHGGVSAMLTMRNWMFIKQYAAIRRYLLRSFHLRALGDFEIGAFEEAGGMIVSVCVSVFQKTSRRRRQTVALRLTLNAGEGVSGERTQRKRAAALCHVGHHKFEPGRLKVVPEWPLVYWWPHEFIRSYAAADLLGDRMVAQKGLITGNDTRYVRFAWEPTRIRVMLVPVTQARNSFKVARSSKTWFPTVMGAQNRVWFEPAHHVVLWGLNGLQCKVMHEHLCGSFSKRVQSESLYGVGCVAFSMIGNRFSARAHRYSLELNPIVRHESPLIRLGALLGLADAGKWNKVAEFIKDPNSTIVEEATELLGHAEQEV